MSRRRRRILHASAGADDVRGHVRRVEETLDNQAYAQRQMTEAQRREYAKQQRRAR